MSNPLRETWTTPFGLPPFDRIEDAHFTPALEAALAETQARIDAITACVDAPSFANVIEPLEAADAPLKQVLAPFHTLLGACASPARQELARAFAPRLAAFRSDLAGNQALFARIEALWAARDTADLSDEQQRVLFLHHRSFVRAGARLDGAEAARLATIMSRLASLAAQFNQILLEDEDAWTLPLTDADLARLPDFVQQAVRSAGDERDTGPIVTLARSVIEPFLQFCPDRDLRRKAHQAWCARGLRPEGDDNRAIAAQTLALRAERAALLGFDNFARYKLDDQMAKTPEAVRDLLMQVWPVARAQAEADAALLTERLRADGEAAPLEAWDWRYYAEARRKAEHDLDEAEIKPYFQLDHMIEAAFDTAHRLFGLAFTPVEVTLWHPDARAWEVTRDGAHVALFIGDYFARMGKRSGAWCHAIRKQSKMSGRVTPIVVNTCNFAKSAPALLSFDAAETLFHEFGHALHQMLSDVCYESISGTSVAGDFVELPSQLFEHWLAQPQTLDRFATHAETGAPMPDALRDRILAATRYDSGFATVEYLASALVDLDLHDRSTPPADPMQAQEEILARIGMPRAIAMRHATPNFAHVFSGEQYAAGYYSYMWSEVMDADAFEAFEERGDVFDPDLAARLEREILSRGGAGDASKLYMAFRGEMPEIGALLRGRGLS